MANRKTGREAEISAQNELQRETPSLFNVFMHNDHYTTMEFVVDMLKDIFHKSETEANQIMLTIHLKGKGLCGIYPFEIAETKAEKVHALASDAGFPLRCTVEET